MSGVWIGQARSIGLWTNINNYVDTYVNVHHTPDTETWYHLWRKYVSEDKILDKDRHFQYIAFRITGNADATVKDCVDKLCDLIPRLADHINILDTNEKGNIQYTLLPYTPLSQTDAIPSLQSSNPFSALQSDSTSSTDHKNIDELDEILNSDDEASKLSTSQIVSPPKSRDSTPIKQFKKAFSNITNAIDEISESKTIPDTATTDFIKDINTLYKNILSAFDQTCQHITTDKVKIFETNHTKQVKNLLHEFENRLDSICNEKLHSFQLRMNTSINSYHKQYEHLEKQMNNITTELESNIKRFQSKPQTPYSKSPSPKRTVKQPSSMSPTIQHYFQKDTLKFLHQGDEYFLQDKDFIKNSPKIQAPKLVNNALTIYSQLQKNASIYSIFLTPIDRITIWDHSPTTLPTTCNLTLDESTNSRQAYQRSAVALYTKLQNMDMSKVPLFKTLLEHERSSQDGYRVLYAMLCVCHPRLVEKPKLEAPTMEPNGNLFSLIRKYSNYIECEKISKRSYSDMEILTFVIDTLDADGRFDKALNIIRIQKNMYEEMLKTQPSTTFPHLLTLNAVPYTIMNVYSELEKQELFGSKNITTNNAIVNSFTSRRQQSQSTYQTRPTTTRQRLPTICPCCGIAGHDIHTSGCDLAASLMLTNEFLQQNRSMKRTIIQKFRAYQDERLNKITTPKNLSKRIQKAAQNKRINISPQVKLLIEAIGDTIEDDPTTDDKLQPMDLTDIDYFSATPEDHTTNEEFHDANVHTSNTSE